MRQIGCSDKPATDALREDTYSSVQSIVAGNDLTHLGNAPKYSLGTELNLGLGHPACFVEESLRYLACDCISQMVMRGCVNRKMRDNIRTQAGNR